MVSQIMQVHAHKEENRQDGITDIELESSGSAHEMLAIIVVVGRSKK